MCSPSCTDHKYNVERELVERREREGKAGQRETREGGRREGGREGGRERGREREREGRENLTYLSGLIAVGGNTTVLP